MRTRWTLPRSAGGSRPQVGPWMLHAQLDPLLLRARRVRRVMPPLYTGPKITFPRHFGRVETLCVVQGARSSRATLVRRWKAAQAWAAASAAVVKDTECSSE